jgi:DNA polymerase II large subunit
MKLTTNDLREMVRKQIRASISEATQGDASDRLDAAVDVARVKKIGDTASKTLSPLNSLKQKISEIDKSFDELGLNTSVIKDLNTTLDNAIKTMTDVIMHPGNYVVSAQEQTSSNKDTIPVSDATKQLDSGKDTLGALGEKLSRKLR